MDSKINKFSKNILTEVIKSTEDNKKSENEEQLNKEKQQISEKQKKRLKKLEVILSKQYISISDLKVFCWQGIPYIPANKRSECWKYLLGFYPLNTELKESTVNRKKEEYSNMCSNYSNALINPEGSMNDQELSIYRQIMKDVPRTMPEHPMFQGDKVKNMMTRILYIWSMRHPASGYVQGFNDLTTPFFVVFFNDKFPDLTINQLLSKSQNELNSTISENEYFDIETDIYFSFTKLLDRIQTHYTSHQPGITKMMEKMKLLIKIIDNDLCMHLEKMEIDYVQFCFRWMNCFLMREFSINLIIRLWDTYFSEDNGFSDFHLYVCSSLLLNFSEKLKKMTEFQEMIMFLQQLPTNNWTDANIEDLLARSYQIRELYSNKIKDK